MMRDNIESGIQFVIVARLQWVEKEITNFNSGDFMVAFYG